MITKKFKLKLLRRLRERHAYCVTWDRREHRYLVDIIVIKFSCHSIAHLSAMSALQHAAAGAATKDPLAGEFMGGTSCGARIEREELIELFRGWIAGLELPAGYLILHVSLCGRVDFHLFTPQFGADGRTLRERRILTKMKTTIRPLIADLNSRRLARGDFSIVNTTPRGKPFFAERPSAEPALDLEPASPSTLIAPSAIPPAEPEPPAPISLPPFRAPSPEPPPKPADSPPPGSKVVAVLPPGPSRRDDPQEDENDEKKRKQREADDARRREKDAARRREEDATREQITKFRVEGEFALALAVWHEHLDDMAGREIPADWRENEVAEVFALGTEDEAAAQFAYSIYKYIPPDPAATPGREDKGGEPSAIRAPTSPAPKPAPHRPDRASPSRTPEF